MIEKPFKKIHAEIKSISVNGFSARDIIFTIPNSSVKSWNRYIVVDDVHIMLKGMTKTGNFDDSKRDVERFFNSFVPVRSAGTKTGYLDFVREYSTKGLNGQAFDGSGRPVDASNGNSSNAINRKSSKYSSFLMCNVPQSPGLAKELVTSLTQIVASGDFMAYGNALNSSAYAKFCSEVSGEQPDDAVNSATMVARSNDGIGYWVVDRGNGIAIGFMGKNN